MPSASISDLRKRGQDVSEPPTYRLPRRISIYLTAALIPTRVTPNQVTLAHGLAVIMAAAAYATGERLALVAGALLIAFSYVLDCVDGELARVRAQTSKIGAQLEQMVHWIAGGVLLIGAAAGAERAGWPLAWPIGMWALVGETSFHYLYNQLNAYAEPAVDYGRLHVLTRSLYRFMPLGTNLMIVGGLTGLLFEALIVWAAISTGAVLIAFSLYYRVEVARAKAAGLQSDRHTP